MPIVALLIISTIGFGISENGFALESDPVWNPSENYISFLETNDGLISKSSGNTIRKKDFELFSQAPEEIKKVEPLKKDRPGNPELINQDIKESVKDDIKKSIRDDVKNEIVNDIKLQIRQDIFDSIKPAGSGGVAR